MAWKDVAMRQSGAVTCADHGASSKYPSENLEHWSWGWVLGER